MQDERGQSPGDAGWPATSRLSMLGQTPDLRGTEIQTEAKTKGQRPEPQGVCDGTGARKGRMELGYPAGCWETSRVDVVRASWKGRHSRSTEHVGSEWRCKSCGWALGARRRQGFRSGPSAHGASRKLQYGELPAVRACTQHAEEESGRSPTRGLGVRPQ